MPYGYLGQTTPNQLAKNSGVLSMSDVHNLTKQGKLGGSLELIEEQNITSSTATVQFINLANKPYDVYFLTAQNVTTDTDNTYLLLQVSADNGSTYRTSGYRYAHWYGLATGSFIEARSANSGTIFLSGNIGTASYEKANSYCYLYNLLDTSAYSSVTHQGSDILSTGDYRMLFGGANYSVAETNNAFKLYMNVGNITTANFKLYGLKKL